MIFHNESARSVVEVCQPKDTESRMQSLFRYTWFLLSAWTITMAVMLAADLSLINKTTKEMCRAEAEARFGRDKAIRAWIASRGGIYVVADAITRPNPYLEQIPERDVTTPSGRRLTLMNPAYMIRTLNEFAPDTTDITGHITSLKPIRPGNSPDQWERDALAAFANGATERAEFIPLDGKPHLRLMRPLLVEKGCLHCHCGNGYKVGDIRGGVTVNVALAPFLARENQYMWMTGGSLFIVWLLGLAGIASGSRGLRKQIRQRDQAEQAVRDYRDSLETQVKERTRALTESLEKVKVLSGMLPICACCKKIRDDQGYWNQLEAYIGKHSDATFSHGICPDCAQQFFQEHHHDKD